MKKKTIAWCPKDKRGKLLFRLIGEVRWKVIARTLCNENIGEIVKVEITEVKKRGRKE